MLLCGILAGTGPADAGQEGRAGRIRPPEAVRCPRNNLTSYTGIVLSYQRRSGSTIVRLRTDENTTERVTIRHRGSRDPSKWFLLAGHPFTDKDWSWIEEARNRLKTGMRATAWVCDDGSNPVIDWQPPHK